MQGQQLKQRRTSAGIPGGALSSRARIARSKLSDIERGYITPNDAELERLHRVLDELIKARQRVAAVAAEVRWPL